MRVLGGVLFAAVAISSASADVATPAAPLWFDGIEPIVYGGYCPNEAATSPLTQSAVGVDLRFNDGSTAVCSGVLAMDQSVVVTAAHCLTDAVEASVVFDIDTDRKETAIRADRMLSHPDYVEAKDAFKANHDIAVLLLERPAPAPYRFVETTTPQTLPKGAEVQVLGYGMRYNGMRESRGRLCITTMKVVGKPENRNLWLAGRGTGECNGDSGAPLLWREGDRYLLAAIVNAGDDDCRLTWATVVADYVDWIRAFIAPPAN